MTMNISKQKWSFGRRGKIFVFAGVDGTVVEYRLKFQNTVDCKAALTLLSVRRPESVFAAAY